MRTIDELSAECKMLSDGELSVLVDKLQAEVKHRNERDQREAWEKVTAAISAYAEEYGAIEVWDDDICICLRARGFSHVMGEIFAG